MEAVSATGALLQTLWGGNALMSEKRKAGKDGQEGGKSLPPKRIAAGSSPPQRQTQESRTGEPIWAEYSRSRREGAFVSPFGTEGAQWEGFPEFDEGDALSDSEEAPAAGEQQCRERLPKRKAPAPPAGCFMGEKK